MIVGVVLVAALAMESISSGRYSITPGTSTPVEPLITVSGVGTNPTPGKKILFTDVYLQALSDFGLFLTHFQRHIQVVPASALETPGAAASELTNQGYLEMYGAKQAAEVAAFRALGWRVHATRVGATVNAVGASSDASRAGLAVGDIISGYDGSPVRSSCDLFAETQKTPAGTTVTLQVEKVTISASGTFHYAAVSDVSVTTFALSKGTTINSGCPGLSNRFDSVIAIETQDAYRYRLPAVVRVNTATIGGPSAGLAMTLAIINQLSRGSLTGDHVVAATGTISPDGQVGAVGGVEEKAVAVHRAGATYFLVPEGGGNVNAAKAADQPNLTILPVRSLAQALADLKRIGGSNPTPVTAPPDS